MDPYNTMVVTQSTDRTCRVHAIKNSGTKVNICGCNVIKKIVSITSGDENTTEVDENNANQAQPSSPSNLNCEVTAGETELMTTPAPTKPTAMRASATRVESIRRFYSALSFVGHLLPRWRALHSAYRSI